MKNNNVSESNCERRKIFAAIYSYSLIVITGIIQVCTHSIPLVPVLLGLVMFAFVVYNVIWGKYSPYLYATVVSLIFILVFCIITILSLKIPFIERIYNWPM